jgi:hypothetical protein
MLTATAQAHACSNSPSFATKAIKNRVHFLFRCNLTAFYFRKALKDIRALFVIKLVHAAMLALNGKRTADKFVLSLWRPSLGSLKQNGNLLLRHG